MLVKGAPGQNDSHTTDIIFKCHFLNEKTSYFDLIFTDVCSWESYLQYSITGSANGSVSIRQQAIIWTNDELDSL